MTTYTRLQERGEKGPYPVRGFRYTGELLKAVCDNGESVTYRIIKGRWTPSGACRDCGDHYIIARYSSYHRINKNDLSIQNDVEDE